MSDLDPVLLARLQFAFTISFHILFPTLTIGLGGFLAWCEAQWLRTGQPVYIHLYKFWVKVFALSFGMGVVSGIVLSYEFGLNFSEFSRIAGPVVGPLIAYEVLTAFFLEAGFLGIMLFGWDKVGPKLHFLATCLVAGGTLLSAFWILSANSWMQTPAGAVFDVAAGHFVTTDWFKAIFNPSFPYRLAHMVTASYLTTSILVSGISAVYLLRGEHLAIARKGFSMGMWAMMVLAPLQIVLGDAHGLEVFEYQPMKTAAIEANWDRQPGAPLILFALPDAKAEKNHLEISIPKLGSFINTHEMEGVLPGLKDVAAEDRPPVGLVFWSFRVMVGLGFCFLGIALWGVLARIRGKLHDWVWLHRTSALFLPAGFVATVAGWWVAEIGRQPYTVYGFLRTKDSVSPVIDAQTIAVSLTAFLLVYGALFGAYLYYMVKLIRRGPDLPLDPGDAPEAIQGARPGLVIPAE